MVFPLVALPIAAGVAGGAGALGAGAGALGAGILGAGVAGGAGALGGLFGGGLSTLLTGGLLGLGLANSLGGQADPRTESLQEPGPGRSKPLNRTVNIPPPSYQHGVQPEHGFFSKFEEGGPVLPQPRFNAPLNSTAPTSMQQYFPNYTPTGPASGHPSWSQIAAATAPVLPPLPSGRPSLQATPFDPMTYGRTDTPNTPQPPPVPSDDSGNSGNSGSQSMMGRGIATFGDAYPSLSGPSANRALPELWAQSQLPVEMYNRILQNRTFAPGGYSEPQFQQGGPVDPRGQPMGQPMSQAQPQGDQVDLYQQTVQALRGRHPDPEAVIRQFIEAFGVGALHRLRMEVAADIAGQVEDGNPSLAGGAGLTSDGMSDSIPATIDGVQPARLSEGEFVVDAPTVAALGNGSTEAGVRQLEAMRQRVRQQAHGSPVQPNAVRPQTVMPA